MPFQDAVERYAWNDNFAIAVNIVREQSPGAFAGAEIVDGDNAWVAFSADVPDMAREVIDRFTKSNHAVAVALKTGLGFTEVELKKAIGTVHYAILGVAGVRDASTSFDFAARTIASSVVLDHGAAPSLDDLQASAVDSLTASDAAEILDWVVVAVVESDVPTLFIDDSNTEHLGGEGLDEVVCTSGFVVYNAYNIRGPSTAGHCINQLHDDGVLLTWKGEHKGQYGDFQWHTGPYPDPDDFYAGSPNTTEYDRRDVAYVTSAVVGQLLCKNGAVGHKDCDEVLRRGVCAGSVCSLVQMVERKAEGGDSGGPVYYQYSAYGLHTGAAWYNGAYRDTFSEAYLMANALGLTVAH